MSNDIEREAFEKAMDGEAHLKWIPEVGEYNSQITQKMWLTWQAARAQGVTATMTRIAEKKLDQMGATVHGVLAKNESGAWVAVSEFGRVMWLDNFEGQSSSAQGEPSSGVPEKAKEAARRAIELCHGDVLDEYPEVARAHIKGLANLILTAAPTPEAEPEDWLPSSSKQWLRYPSHPQTNQPDSEQGGEWISVDERLPTEADADIFGNVWCSGFWDNPNRGIAPINWSNVGKGAAGDTHWKPTGLTRPQPPKSKEGQL